MLRVGAVGPAEVYGSLQAMQSLIATASSLPNEDRVRTCRALPERGPAILFFSGGSALHPLSRALQRYTHRSIHVITPFDSGGSSASLRRAFGILSVGDLRHRLLALADERLSGRQAIEELCSHRFSKQAPNQALLLRFQRMLNGRDALMQAVPEPTRAVLRSYLARFGERALPGFDLRGANIGNLLLVGGYLAYGGDIQATLEQFSRLLRLRGRITPVVEEGLHLAALLNDGRRVYGQHNLTGKEAAPISQAIRSLFLVDDIERPRQTEVLASARVLDWIGEAELICYPMGSFYTSVVANLLPGGIGVAVANARCPKLYIPNTGVDPEQVGMRLSDCVATLLATLRHDAGKGVPASRLLDWVLIDSSNPAQRAWVDDSRSELTAMGIEVLDVPMRPRTACGVQHDPRRLAKMLISLT